jgi:hypothetical protein
LAWKAVVSDQKSAFQYRSRREGKTSVPTPWGGRFSDYRELGGIRVPTRAEVRWELPEGPFTYWHRPHAISLDVA